MAYTTGTEVSDAAPATTLVTRIETALTAHAAWEYVEEVTAGSYTVRVWKNLGTANTWGTDWYLGVMYTSATSSVYFSVAEVWNTGANTVERFAYGPGYTDTPDATYRSHTGALAWDSSSVNKIPLAVDVTTFGWRIHLNADRLIVSTAIGANPQGVIYSGLFDVTEPFASANWASYEFPLVVAPMLNSDAADTDGAGSTTRRPMTDASTTDCFAVNTTTSGASAWVTTYTSYERLGEMVTCDPIGSKLWVQMTNIDYVNGFRRGMFNESLQFYGTVPAAAGGDTVTIGAASWVSLCNYGNFSYWVPND